ncbi:hypothetical protein DH2020_011582 [Rehmannia glutinosa]|uniref:Uncharacterized protein n=1 Tax=Rehmannia glutinosa TaxID=99300 RepID=A0ABR0XDV9_REHGL
MDLNFKSKLWAGNIYHQFESICQDVDDFMSKDTVKFVENQVQSVGISVKRLYSNVVQDILPLSGDIAKPKSQSVDGEQVDTRDHVNIVADITTNPTSVNGKQLSENQGSIDTFRNSDASLPIEVDHVTEFTRPPCADPSLEAKTNLDVRKDCDALICNDIDNGVEENITRVLIQVAADSNPDNEIFSEASDEDCKNSTPTVAFSPHEEGLITVKMERRGFNHQKEKKGFSDETEWCSLISSSDLLFGSKLPVVEDPNSDENGSLSDPTVASPHKVNEDNSLMMDSSDPSDSDVAQRALEKYMSLCERISTKDGIFRVFEDFSCDGEEEKEMGERSSTCSSSPKSSNISDATSENFIKKAKNICHSHAESNGCGYNISTPSSTTEADETKAVDLLPAFLFFESKDNAFHTDGSGFVGASYEQHYKDGRSGIVISPSETGNTYEFGFGDGDLNMETVDLSPDAKHDEKSVVLNGNFVHRRRNFRYYKDALTSRKRLSKEYEHLAILYGDIDFESRQHFESSSVPSSPNTSVHAVRTPSFQEMSESEWELV